MSGTEGDQKHENSATPFQPEPALVLIAEDEEPIAEALAMLVEDCGYIPLVASNGRQALELARARRPSLVITDMMMPYMDGVELIASLRQDAALDAHAPPAIILLSAAGLRRMRAAGADAILSKPFDLNDLEGLLRRFLGPPPVR